MAVFVEDISKLFDSFSSVKCAAPGKTLHSLLSDNSPHMGHWTKASMGIKSWIFPKVNLPSRNQLHLEWVDYWYWWGARWHSG
jgi:hypothetical protein